MPKLPKKLLKKLKSREENNALRQLPLENALVDFSSNDYLGFSRSEEIYDKASNLLKKEGMLQNGATGSRLLTGNHTLYDKLEKALTKQYQSEAALVFNSGYDANIGFFSSVPQRGDVIFYDELIHASIRDGIKMGNAQSYKYKHNDLEDLKEKMLRFSYGNDQKLNESNEIYVVTESVFSMDGDSPDLMAIGRLCKETKAHLIVDEAHAIGILGKNGVGVVQELGLQDAVFARIITFGKAFGCHGAAILGTVHLKNYLVNFARSLMYTTGLPPHSVATIMAAHQMLQAPNGVESSKNLNENIKFFNQQLKNEKIGSYFIPSESAIQSCMVPGNKKVKSLATELKAKGFDVKPILSPTVPVGKERLRFCIHSYNTKGQISEVLKIVAKKI